MHVHPQATRLDKTNDGFKGIYKVATLRVRRPAELELRAIFVLFLRASTISPGAERDLSPLPARYRPTAQPVGRLVKGATHQPRAAIGWSAHGAALRAWTPTASRALPW